MWEEFKFAINPFAGDTKPNPAVTAEANALSRASSRLMSKVLTGSQQRILHPLRRIKVDNLLVTFAF